MQLTVQESWAQGALRFRTAGSELRAGPAAFINPASPSPFPSPLHSRGLGGTGRVAGGRAGGEGCPEPRDRDRAGRCQASRGPCLDRGREVRQPEPSSRPPHLGSESDVIPGLSLTSPGCVLRPGTVHDNRNNQAPVPSLPPRSSHPPSLDLYPTLTLRDRVPPQTSAWTPDGGVRVPQGGLCVFFFNLIISVLFRDHTSCVVQGLLLSL